MEKSSNSLVYPYIFDKENFDPYENIKWKTTDVKLLNVKGQTLFNEQVEFPDFYDENQISVIADKYLCNRAKKKETSLKELFNRVSETIGKSGLEQGYFNNENEMNIFINKLKYYQVHQYFAFNSPVYFHIGLNNKPIVSACFILEMNDDIYYKIIDSMFPKQAEVKMNTNSGEISGELGEEFQKPRNSITEEQLKNTGRNDPCPCGSGKKFKKCCGA